MNTNKRRALRSLLAGAAALIFFGAGTAFAAPSVSATADAAAAESGRPAAAFSAAPASGTAADTIVVRGELRMSDPDTADSETVPAPPTVRRSAATTAGEFYGDQLPEAARVIYDAVLDSDLRSGPTVISVEMVADLPEAVLCSGDPVTAVCDGNGFSLDYNVDPWPLQNAFDAASAALLYDHPELSWLVNTDTGIRYSGEVLPTENDWAALGLLQPGQSLVLEGPFRFTSVSYVMTPEGVRLATTAPEDADGANRWQYAATGSLADIEAALETARREIGTLSGLTDAGKVQAVHDWLCAHVEYADKNGDRFRGEWRGYQTAYSALVEQESVCAGYARALKLLCDAYGIPCVIVRGDSRGEAHAWNYVQLSGRWYGLDATWADQPWGISRSHYLKGSNVFMLDHTARSLAPEADLRYPPLASEDYTEDAPALERTGDVNLDGMVNLADLVCLAVAFGEGETGGYGDLDSDGTVDIADLLLLGELLRREGYDQGAGAQTDGTVGLRLSGPESVRPGQVVQITVSGAGEALCAGLTTSGLQFQSVSSQLSDADVCVLLPDYGTSQVTYTYQVEPQAREVSVQLQNSCRASGSTVTRVADGRWAAPVEQPAQLEDAVQLSGGDFVYAGADVPLKVQINDSRISAMSGQLACTGFAVDTVPVEVTRTENGFAGGSVRLTVSAAPGETVRCTLTGMTAVVDGERMSLPDRTYVAPVRQLNRPADYLTVNGPAALKTGDTVQLVVSGNAGIAGLSADVQMTGLAYVSVSSQSCSQSRTVLAPESGAKTVTYTCRVTAGPGETASFRLRNVVMSLENDMLAAAPEIIWQASVSTGTAVSGPEVRPTPEVPVVAGYDGGLINGRPFLAKPAGSRTMFNVQRSDGSLRRVAAPYVTDSDGQRYYPISMGGMVLFPRLTDGRVTAYCRYADGQEIPVLQVAASSSADNGALQPCTVGSRTFWARTSGERMMFYVRRSDASLYRVAAPYVTGRDGQRFYPVNCGGTVLVPQLLNGTPAAYLAGETTVLTRL